MAMIPTVKGRINTLQNKLSQPGANTQRIQGRISYLQNRYGAGNNAGAGGGTAGNTPAATTSSIPGATDRQLNRYNYLNQAYGAKRANRFLNKRGLSLEADTSSVDTSTTADAGSDATSPTMTDENQAKLFPGTTDTLLDWRIDKGKKAMDALMASKGLTDSGAEVQANSDMIAQLTAEEAARKESAGQTEADRLASILENEAQRKERVGNTEYDRMYNMLNLLLGQNPYSTAAQGSYNLANLYTQLAGMV